MNAARYDSSCQQCVTRRLQRKQDRLCRHNKCVNNENNLRFIQVLLRTRGGSDDISTSGGGESKKKSIVKSSSLAESSTSKETVEPSTSTTPKKSKKKKKKKKKKTPPKDDDGHGKDESKVEVESDSITTFTAKDEQNLVNQVLREKDAADALGDAIRDRAVRFRHPSRDNNSGEYGELAAINDSVHSVGWALGASDQRTLRLSAQQQQKPTGVVDDDDDESGGVEAAPTSVLVHYFMKSHGGAHALQCVCSLLSTLAGLGALFLVPSTTAATTSANAASSVDIRLTLVSRCLLFAMIKHVSGLLATTLLTARAIPTVGLRQARTWMEELATDPVSQYTFYAACILLWLPQQQGLHRQGLQQQQNSPSDGNVKNALVGFGLWWWWDRYPKSTTCLLLGPVVVREIISTLLVISDVLVLWALSSPSPSNGKNNTTAEVVKKILSVSIKIVDAIMSLVATPAVWRKADAAHRQAILATYTNRLSIVLEIGVGMLLLVDAIWMFVTFTFVSLEQRPAILQLFKRLLCTRLYMHYLWIRRRKISSTITQIRGGAAEFPLYVLDVLLHPQNSMGLTNTNSDYSDRSLTSNRQKREGAVNKDKSEWRFQDYLQIILGIE